MGRDTKNIQKMNSSRNCFINYCGEYSLGEYNCWNIDVIVNGYPVSTREILVYMFVLGTWCLGLGHLRKLRVRIKELEKEKIKIV